MPVTTRPIIIEIADLQCLCHRRVPRMFDD